MSADKDDHVYNAKLAEQAERYDGNFYFIIKIGTMNRCQTSVGIYITSFVDYFRKYAVNQGFLFHFG